MFLLALSGGADSVALALMMKEQGKEILALHCNFHLRGEESDRDETFVRSFCQQHNIPLEVKHFDTFSYAHSKGISIEMAARELRYNWFRDRAIETGAEGILVAHHKNDQAETLLLNLIRGTGLRGLAGMKEDRIIDGLRIIRPLLKTTKEYILHYLKEHHQDFVTDSTNLERDAMRNRIRLDVIPLLKELNPNIIDTLSRTADIVRGELEHDEWTEFYRQHTSYGFSTEQLHDIFLHLHAETPSSGSRWISNTHTAYLNRGKLIIEDNRQQTEANGQQSIDYRLTIIKTDNPIFQKDRFYIDLDTITQPLSLRKALPGDRFTPFGMKGTKLISDFLTDRKVPLPEKQRQLVATSGNTIVWVVGQEIDNHFRVTPESKNIAELTINYEVS